MNTSTHPLITFIGGGNMASAIIGGLVRQGHPTSALQVVEPWDEQRAKLAQQFPGMAVLPVASAELKPSDLVVWAVKPQTFKDAAAAARPHVDGALHLSVAAGITSDSIAAWLGTERIVRAMPNTPALIGMGITGLYAAPETDAAERARAEQVLAAVGEVVWVDEEALLDPVTAVSGSGPAYVFWFIEHLAAAGEKLGLAPQAAAKLALATVRGAAELAARSGQPPATLREQVTSQGGTTAAALAAFGEERIAERLARAVAAASRRGETLGRELDDA